MQWLQRKLIGDQNISVIGFEQTLLSVNAGYVTRVSKINLNTSAPARRAERLVAEAAACCFLRCTVWHKNLGPVVRTVQLQILCISTHLMWGGRMGGVQRPWSAGLMPQEQSGFSVLLKVSATTDMYAHWQSNHWAPLLPEWLDSIKQQSHLNNKSVKP